MMAKWGKKRENHIIISWRVDKIKNHATRNYRGRSQTSKPFFEFLVCLFIQGK